MKCNWKKKTHSLGLPWIWKSGWGQGPLHSNALSSPYRFPHPFAGTIETPPSCQALPVSRRLPSPPGTQPALLSEGPLCLHDYPQAALAIVTGGEDARVPSDSACAKVSQVLLRFRSCSPWSIYRLQSLCVHQEGISPRPQRREKGIGLQGLWALQGIGSVGKLHKDLSSSPRSHIKKPGIVIFDCNTNAGDMVTGGSLGLSPGFQ